jgi:hypothetical protein
MYTGGKKKKFSITLFGVARTRKAGQLWENCLVAVGARSFFHFHSTFSLNKGGKWKYKKKKPSNEVNIMYGNAD